MSGENDDAADLYDGLADNSAVPTEADAGANADPAPVEPVDLAHEPAPVVPATPAPEPEPRWVPLAEHLSEREKRQEYQRKVEAAQAREAQYQRTLEQMQSELQGLKAPKQEPGPTPDQFENGEKWFEHHFGKAVEQVVGPLQQQLQQLQQYSEAELQETGYRFAVQQHGAEAVNGAQSEILELVNQGDPDAVADYRRIMAARPSLRHSELMRWKNNRTIYSEVAQAGGDIGKYKKSLEERLLADPTFLAKALERAQADAASRAPVVVTQSSAPERRPTSLRSVSQMGAAANGNPGRFADMSGADQYDSLLSPKRK